MQHWRTALCIYFAVSYLQTNISTANLNLEHRVPNPQEATVPQEENAEIWVMQ